MEVAHDREMRCGTFRRQTLPGFRKGNNVTICRSYKNHCVLYTQRKSLVPISDETGYATKDATAARHIPGPCGYALCYYGGLFHFRHPWPIIDLREMSASPNSKQSKPHPLCAKMYKVVVHFNVIGAQRVTFANRVVVGTTTYMRD